MELVSVRETEWQKTEKAISAVTWSIWHCARVILPFHIVSKSSLIVNYIYSLNCPNKKLLHCYYVRINLKLHCIMFQCSFLLMFQHSTGLMKEYCDNVSWNVVAGPYPTNWNFLSQPCLRHCTSWNNHFFHSVLTLGSPATFAGPIWNGWELGWSLFDFQIKNQSILIIKTTEGKRILKTTKPAGDIFKKQTNLVTNWRHKSENSVAISAIFFFFSFLTHTHNQMWPRQWRCSGFL